MPAVTGDLRAAILARLDEIEAEARAAPAGGWEWSDRGHSARLWAQVGDEEPRLVVEVNQGAIGYSPSDRPGEWISSTGAASHIARHAPPFVLRWVAALRRLVDGHWPENGAHGPQCGPCSDVGRSTYPCPDLVDLAAAVGLDVNGEPLP